MARYRSQWKRNYKVLSAMKSNTGLTVSAKTHADTSFQTCLDQSITAVKQRRPVLSDSVRVSRGRPRVAPIGRKWKFHTLNFTAQDIYEPVIAWRSADASGGTRLWDGSGNLTQFHMYAGNGRPLPAWPNVTSAYAEAEIQAKVKALGYLDRPRLSLGEPLGELQTLPRDLSPILHGLERVTRGFGKEITRLGRFIKRSPRGKLLAGASQVVAETWAKYAFFAAPLVRTAEDVVTEYASRMEVTDLWQTARGIANSRTAPVFKTTQSSGSGWIWRWEQVRWIEYEVHAGILFSSADRTTSVPGRLGLVKRDWPVTAWELFPLSFMIDRVINVKRFLRTSMALTSPEVTISRDSFITVRQKDVKTCRISNIWAPLCPQCYYSPTASPWARYEDFSFSRSRWWPDLGEVAHTARGSGLFNEVRKMADVTALVQLHLHH